MKTLIVFLFFFFGLVLSAQETTSQPFKNSSNKYYFGASISPTLVALLNGQSFEPEWKIAYKHRLGMDNHYVRLSYSYLRANWYSYYPNTNGMWGDYYYGGKQTIQLNDSTDWVSGYFKNVYNNQIVKLGYEYQFKVGQKRSLSVNLGGDFMLGFRGGKLYNANDTITYKDEVINGESYRNIVNIQSESELIAKAQVFYGLSPFIALGIPLKKRFDLTLEMAFDCSASPSNIKTGTSNALNINYRPSVMLSYRFDEKVSRNDSRSKGSKRE